MEVIGSNHIIIFNDVFREKNNLINIIMKLKSINILSLIMLGLIVLLGSCDKNDDYDFSAIEPVIMSISGPGTVLAHGDLDYPVRFLVPHRGGSTFEWEVSTLLGLDAVIVKDSEYSSIAWIAFEQTSDSDEAIITVTETTMGGKTTSLSRTINLNPFCPIPDEVEGEYISTSDWGTQTDVTVTKDPEPGVLVVEGVLGWWGFGTDGKIRIVLDYCTGEVRMETQPTGVIHNEYGNITLQEAEDASYDFDTGVITIPTEVTVSLGSFGGMEITLTPAP